jgi:hypothetical protein
LAFHYTLSLYRQDDDADEDFNEMPHVSKAIMLLNVDEIKDNIELEKSRLRNFIPELEAEKSGWKFHSISDVVVSISKYVPLKNGSYLPLPALINNKKCCINIKNDDDRCLMYCVLYHIHQKEILKDADRVSKYKPFLNEFNWSNIKFPVSLNDISKVEKLIDYGINIFDYDDNITRPRRMSERKDDKIINLLSIGDRVNNVNIKHFVYIKKLDVLIMNKKNDENGVHRCDKSFICVNCLHPFSSCERLQNHKDNGCDMFEPTKTELPKFKKVGDKFVKPTIQFEHYNRKFKAPVVIYGDFETLIEKTNNNHNKFFSLSTQVKDLPQHFKALINEIKKNNEIKFSPLIKLKDFYLFNLIY